MWALLAESSAANPLWFAIPLIIVVSLVYGATRHETMAGILLNAYHSATWIISFMAVIFVVLFIVSWWV